MSLKISSAPAVEPISLSAAKLHLRLDSGSLSDNVTSYQSIAPGSHAIVAAYALVGTAIDVLGYEAVVEFESGTNGAGGTVDVKLQDSDDNTTWTDVTSGAFTQVTTVNDNATFEKAYTGTKQYLRVVATVAGNSCEFGVSILVSNPTSIEDTLITAYIKAAREWCENFQNRSYITQTWELWLDEFPDNSYLELPLPPLASVTSVKYYDTANTEYTLSAASYFVDTKSEPGGISLTYGYSWPSTTLRPINGVCVTFVAGYGASGSYVPFKAMAAMYLLIGDYYANREAGKASEKTIAAVERLLWMDRIL
jgi:uncharacterized phiE125 gp8 family phage protein